MDKPIVLQLKGITKRFGTKVVANDHVDLDLRQGEILSILGENGSGKTTLMNMIIGIYRQDEGNIFINGEEVTILSPKDAYKYKIGNVPNKFITQYIDKQAPTGSILYQVSTLYGKDESKKADADKEVNVGNEKIILSETTISPTVFTDQVELFGNEKVDLLEVITLDGKTVIRQKNPGKIVYTGSLSSGIYIFRIHTDGKAKTMKAQKIN
jgi:ABC-type glutathione transport system ATPase component